MTHALRTVCERDWAALTDAQRETARTIYESAEPDGDLSLLIASNSAVAAYYIRCGRLGYEPEDGE